MISLDELQHTAAETGFGLEPLEKIARLLEVLEALGTHPYLKGRLALKGGTALNLLHFAVPRLSVDIDLNYIGSTDRDTALAERGKVDKAVAAVCGRLELAVHRAPTEHAGGKWRLRYPGVFGRQGRLELDVNFMLRAPLWPPEYRDSHPLGPLVARRVSVLDVHELAAGKLAALCSRAASRDLFDAHYLLGSVDFDDERLRLAFVVYGGINRRDWTRVSIDDVTGDPVDVARQLVPMLRADLAPAAASLESWTRQLVADCQHAMRRVLPLRDHEMAFLQALNQRGEIIPELLTDDPRLREILRNHPGLKWKAQNVRSHLSRGAPLM